MRIVILKTFSVVAVLTTLFSASCSLYKKPVIGSSRVGPKITRPNYSTFEDVSVPATALNWTSSEFDEFGEKIRSMLSERDFAGLDAFAASIRSTRARFQAGGGWKIHSFYSVASEPDSTSSWSAHISLLSDWKSATGSMASRVSLSNAYTGWAWEARGSGFASDIDAKNIAVFEERMRKAEVELVEASKLKEMCYGYFESKMVLERTTGSGSTDHPAAFEQAIAFDPEYQYFYTEMAVTLLPRWSGTDGQLIEFAEALIESLGETRGLQMYYLVVSALHELKHDDFYKETGLSWRKTKKGFVLYDAEFGSTPYRVNQFTRLAIAARDPQAACNSFKRMVGPNDYDPSAWNMPKEAFDARRKPVIDALCKMPRADNQEL